MTEYIAKRKAKEAVDYAIELSKSEYDMMCAAINQIPAADVAPVVHGKWEFEPETINTYSVLKCSKCGWWTLDLSVDGSYHHCPNCGAKMD